ncbi:hypothetical protein [Lagierella massiliensis]|uniref:hypothetical protein n=1 Tax=Lagierella massiliensis TaxID=1689303 RepID=UPI0006D85E88|nr:hypothetical protein [Lagierella massiliensis]
MKIQSDIKNLIAKELNDDDLIEIALNFIERIKDNRVSDENARIELLQNIERYNISRGDRYAD